jgi:hypothetical protein
MAKNSKYHKKNEMRPMTGLMKKLACEGQSFEEIIKDNYLYLDVTVHPR